MKVNQINQNKDTCDLQLVRVFRVETYFCVWELGGDAVRLVEQTLIKYSVLKMEKQKQYLHIVLCMGLTSLGSS